MAFYRDILRMKYPGTLWRIDGDDYATLVWSKDNKTPKPTQAELDAFTAEVDTKMSDEATKANQAQAFLRDSPDVILRAIEILVRSVDDIQDKLQASALQNPLNPTRVSQIDELREKIIAIRNTIT